jgi:hypothetical protein
LSSGKVYGRLVWRGRPKDTDKQITSALKKQWSLLDLPDYTKFGAKEEELKNLIPTKKDEICSVSL